MGRSPLGMRLDSDGSVLREQTGDDVHAERFDEDARILALRNRELVDVLLAAGRFAPQDSTGFEDVGVLRALERVRRG